MDAFQHECKTSPDGGTIAFFNYFNLLYRFTLFNATVIPKPFMKRAPMVLWSYGPMVLWSYGPMVSYNQDHYSPHMFIYGSLISDHYQDHMIMNVKSTPHVVYNSELY